MDRNWIRVVAVGFSLMAGVALVSQVPQARAVDKPDLVVRSVSVPSTAMTGTTVMVTVVVSNQATTGIATPSTTYIYLGTNLSIVGLNNVGTHSVSTLVAGSSFTHSNSITIPATTPSGNNIFIAVCDKPNVVVESNENNNTNTATINITK